MERARNRRGVEGTVEMKEKRRIFERCDADRTLYSNSAMSTCERFVTRLAKVDYLPVGRKDFRSNSWIRGRPAGELKLETLFRC